MVKKIVILYREEYVHTIQIFTLDSDEQDDLEIAFMAAARAALDLIEVVTWMPNRNLYPGF